MLADIKNAEKVFPKNFSTKFISVPLKWCSQCAHLLPVSQFRLNGKHYYSLCKKCSIQNGFLYRAKNKEVVAKRQKTYAQSHKKEIAEYQRNWTKQNPDKVHNTTNKYRANHREKIILCSKKYRDNLKYLVFEHYGQFCSLCGEKQVGFLCVDHIEGRQKWGHDRTMTGTKMYRWLKNNNFPSGFRILCFNCNMKLAYHFGNNEFINDMQRYSQKYRKHLREKVIAHYSKRSSCCACCGISDIDVLGIDHINGGGNQHRKQIGKDATYLWLVKNNFPEGFQVLCHNCNMSKWLNGRCLHEVQKL